MFSKWHWFQQQLGLHFPGHQWSVNTKSNSNNDGDPSYNHTPSQEISNNEDGKHYLDTVGWTHRQLANVPNICFKVLCTCFVTLYAQSLHILTFNRKYRTSTVKIHFHIYCCIVSLPSLSLSISNSCWTISRIFNVSLHLCLYITYFRSLPPLSWVWRGLSRGPETSRDWGRLAASSPPQPHSSPGSVLPAEGRNLSLASGCGYGGSPCHPWWSLDIF